MKRIILLATFNLFCFGVLYSAHAQQRKGQKPSQPKATQAQEKTDSQSRPEEQQEAVRPKQVPEMTIDEKLKFWKGQKVIILPFLEDPKSCYPPGPCSQLRRYNESEGFNEISKVTRAEFYKPYFEHGLRSDAYALKTGAIVAARVRVVDNGFGGGDPRMEWLINLDGSTEKVVARSGPNEIVGFFAELESAKALIGRSLWIRGKPRWDLDPPIEVKNTQRVTVTRAEWKALKFGARYASGSILLCVKTDIGKESCILDDYGYVEPRLQGGYFDPRFQWDPYRNFPYLRDEAFYFEDPHKKFPKWSKQIWELIEDQEIAIGMTEDQARVACGANLSRAGVVLSSPDGSGVIYSCGGRKYLINNGKVIKFVQ